jgi:hypothetical protein
MKIEYVLPSSCLDVCFLYSHTVTIVMTSGITIATTTMAAMIAGARPPLSEVVLDGPVVIVKP